MRFATGESHNLMARVKDFAVRIVKLYAKLPKSPEAQVIGKQLLRSGTSVGAHIAEANRARSLADFCNKLDGAIQELGERQYWLELLVQLEIVRQTQLRLLFKEIDELCAIFVTIANKSRKYQKSV